LLCEASSERLEQAETEVTVSFGDLKQQEGLALYYRAEYRLAHDALSLAAAEHATRGEFGKYIEWALLHDSATPWPEDHEG